MLQDILLISLTSVFNLTFYYSFCYILFCTIYKETNSNYSVKL